MSVACTVNAVSASSPYGFSVVTPVLDSFSVKTTGTYKIGDFTEMFVATIPAGSGTFKGGFVIACPLSTSNFTGENQVCGSVFLQIGTSGSAGTVSVILPGLISPVVGTTNINIDIPGIPKIATARQCVISVRAEIFLV